MTKTAWLTLVLLALPAAAEARSQGESRPPSTFEQRDPRAREPSFRDRAPAQVCVPWCPADLNPCDPPSFKQADGRCFQEN